MDIALFEMKNTTTNSSTFELSQLLEVIKSLKYSNFYRISQFI